MELKGTISVVSLDPIDFQSKDKNSETFFKMHIKYVIFSTNVILLKQVFFIYLRLLELSIWHENTISGFLL